MTKKHSEEFINEIILQMEQDIANGDTAELEVLLHKIDGEALLDYLYEAE